jgi:hypothetical protein
MATKLTTGFMRTPTYKSSLDGNTTSLNMPSVFDSITKYKNIEASKILGEYTTYTPPSKGNTSGLEAIGWSGVLGLFNTAKGGIDAVFTRLQLLKSGAEKSISNITQGTLNADQQSLVNKYNEAQATGRELDKATKQKLLNINFGANAGLTKQEEFDIRAGKENVGTPKLSEARKKVEQWFQPKTEAMTKRIDIENRAGITKFFGGLAQSAPYTAISRIKYLGWFINYAGMEANTINEQIMRFQQSGVKITPELQDRIRMYATGSAIIEATSEMLFPAAKGAFKTSTIKELGKFIAKQSGQESFEEILSYLGQGILAKFTVDPSAKLFDWTNKNNALVTLTGGLEAGLAGAVMGSIYSGVGGMIGMRKTKKALKAIENKTVEETSVADIQPVETALKEDLKDQDNVDELFEDLAVASVVVSESMTPEQEIDSLNAVSATLSQELKNQPIGSQEREATEATARTAEAHLKELYRQQQEAITQATEEAARSRWHLIPSRPSKRLQRSHRSLQGHCKRRLLLSLIKKHIQNTLKIRQEKFAKLIC